MKHKLFYWWAVITLVFLFLPSTALAVDSPVGVSYRGHIQDRGDYPLDGSWVDSPEIIGTVGQSKRIEGFEIKLTGTVPEGMELRYNVHVQNKGWLYDENDSADWPKDGVYAGTRGDGLRIEAVKIVLTDRAGKALTGYSVQYRGHVQNVGDLPADKTQWLVDGAQLGTVGSSLRLEALLVQVVKTAVDPPEPIEPTVYDKAGTYGPTTGTETVAGDVTIAADGVILQNLVIQGNLTISEAVGDGNVTLNNVTVKGDTFVHGGGVNSIKINGGAYSRIVMEKTASGAVRILATDVDGMAVVIAEDATGETIILEGKFDSVEVNAPNMTVTTQGATTTIGTMTVSAGAAGSTVTVAAGTTVSDLVLDGKAAVKGQGNVVKVEVKADGVVFDKKPGAVTVEPGVVIPPVFPTPDSGGVTPPGPIAVTAVSLNKSALILSFDDTEILAATVAPADATNKTVTWTTSDATIATVDATGKVTGSANTEGEATITATSADGTQSANCTVAVTRFKVTKTTDGIGTITGMNGSSTDITIPETIGGLTITAIGTGAFQSSAIECVVIPKTVKEIGYHAFGNCFLMGTVTFAPNSTLETIGASAFANNHMSSLILPNSVTSIGSNAFEGCTILNYITIPAAVTTIPDQAFSGCSSLSGVKMASGLTAIGTEAFNNCSKLTDIEIPKGVISIGNAAFGFDAGKAPASRSYTFRGDVPGTIGASAIPITVTHIPTIKYYENYIGFTTVDWAGYTKAVILEKPTLTDPMATNIGTPTVDISWAAVTNATGYQVYFSKKSDLSDATITPVTEAKAKIETGLEPRQLYYFAVKAQDAHGESLLSEVKPVRIPTFEVTGVTLDKETLSVGVTKTAQLNASVEPANATDQTLKWTFEKDTVATVDANGLVTGISEGTTIIRVSTPDYTFSKICTVTVTEGYDVSVTDNKATITKYYGDNKDVVIPDTIDVNGTPIEVVAIGDAAFGKTQAEINSGDMGITAVTIPAKVTSIGTMAFNNCRNLTMVTFDSGSQLSIIGGSSFSGCKSLSNIILPDTATTIGDYAFGNCSVLKTLALPETLTTIGINAFYFTGLTAITIPSQVTSIPISAFYGCQGLTTIDLPAGLQTIGNTAFAFTGSQTPIARTFTFNGDAPALGTAAIPVSDGTATVTIKYINGSNGFGISPWTDCNLRPIS